MGAEGLPQTLREQILNKVEGNPYFVEEMIRSLIETKQIVPEKGHWRMANKGVSLSLPGTLNGVLSARIDRLPEDSKQLLQMASVIGRSFDLRLLRGLSNLNGTLDDHIQILTKAGLIQLSSPRATSFVTYSSRKLLITQPSSNAAAPSIYGLVSSWKVFMRAGWKNLRPCWLITFSMRKMSVR